MQLGLVISVSDKKLDFAASKNGQSNPLKRKADQADGLPKSAGIAGDKKSKVGDGESDDIGDGIEEIGEDDEDEDDDETDAERLQVWLITQFSTWVTVF